MVGSVGEGSLTVLLWLYSGDGVRKKNDDVEPKLKSFGVCGYGLENCINSTDEVVTSTASAIASVSSIRAAATAE